MDKIFNNESVAQDDTLDEILTFNKENLAQRKKKTNPIFDEISSKSEREYKQKYNEMLKKDERKKAYEDNMAAKQKFYQDSLKDDKE